ncbi:MAG TPA: lysophospholipid acyltransferase family protein [Kofleriaceae bacterium]
MIGFELFRATHHVGRGLFNALAELGSARTTQPRDPLEAVHRLAGAVGTIGRAHELAVTTRGEIPRGRALIVANHVSYLDPIAILPHCPAAPLAKAEVLEWPIVGSIGEALGVIFVARRDRMARARSLRRIHDLLAAGVPVLNFPEGTTTRGDKVGPFWRGTFGVAQRLGVPVIPVAIHYRDPEMAWCGGAAFLPHYIKVASRPKIEITLSFCPALPVRTGESPEDMAARARNVIARALDEMRSPDAGIRSQLSPSRSNPVFPTARVA